MVGKGLGVPVIAEELNAKLHTLLPTGYFCCAAIMKLSADRHQLTLWNGGLPPVLVRRQVNGELVEIRANNLPLPRIFHPLLAFPGSQWMEDVVPRTGRGKAREGLFSRLQAHLPLTPLFVNVPGQHSPEVILAPVAQPRCRTGVDKGKRLREGTGFAGYCARRSRQL